MPTRCAPLNKIRGSLRAGGEAVEALREATVAHREIEQPRRERLTYSKSISFFYAAAIILRQFYRDVSLWESAARVDVTERYVCRTSAIVFVGDENLALDELETAKAALAAATT